MTPDHAPRILLIHSDVRSYRVPIFQMLHEQYSAQFVFMYGGGLAKQFHESAQWNYINLKQYPMVGYSSDFSPGLIKLLFKIKNSYDVIISSGLSTFATHASFLIAKMLRKKFIVWAEDWVWPKNMLSRIALPYVKIIGRNAAACIAAGTKTHDFFVSLGARPEKIFMAPNCALDLSIIPIDQEKLNTLRQKINPENKIVISYLGRIVRYKALDTLINAFAKLEKENTSALLLIVGDGPFAPVCAKLLQSLHIKNFYWPQYAKLTGTKEIEPIPPSLLWQFLRISDVVVLPGRFILKDHVPCESWGLILNEALSLGKPIVSTTSVAAAYDLIQNDKNGYQIENDNPEALFTALKKMASDKVRLKKMSEFSRAHFYTHFQYSLMFEGFKKALTAVCKKPH